MHNKVHTISIVHNKVHAISIVHNKVHAISIVHNKLPSDELLLVYCKINGYQYTVVLSADKNYEKNACTARK